MKRTKQQVTPDCVPHPGAASHGRVGVLRARAPQCRVPRVGVHWDPPAKLVSLLPCGCSLRRPLTLEELNNCNNDDKIEMALPAEQKLEKTRRFPHPPYCFWPCLPTAPGRCTAWPPAGPFELWPWGDTGDPWRVSGASAGVCLPKGQAEESGQTLCCLA